jgi:hypothetical protein
MSAVVKSALFGGTPTPVGGGGVESSTSYLFPIIAGIVGLLLVVMLIYVVVLQIRNRPVKALTGPEDLWGPKNPVVVDRNVVRSQMAANYTLAFYLKVDAVPDIRTANTEILYLPGVFRINYDAASETLVVPFTQSGGFTADTLRIPGFSLQRWNQVTFTLEGRTLDVYINGTLAQSALLANVPPSGSSSITIVPNSVMGSVAYAQLWPRRLTVAEVAANYASTSDSQGRPFLNNTLLAPLTNIPNLFCPGGDCFTTAPTASPAQQWEFPYA